MKNYTYTCREKNGNFGRGQLEAEDRAAAFSRLREQDRVVLSLVEGGPHQTHPDGGVRVSLWTVAVAVLSLALVVGYFVWPSPVQTKKVPPEKKSIEPQKVVEKNAPENKVNAIKKVESSPLPKPAQVKPTDPEPAEIKQRDVAGNIIAQPKSRRARGGQGRLEEALEQGRPIDPLFTHDAENFLALYTRPGEPVAPPPLPDNLDEAVQKMLSEDIVITPEDTTEQQEEKEIVAWMKEDFRTYLKGGGTAEGYFQMIQVRQEAETLEYDTAREMVSSLYREGKIEDALKTYEQVNAELGAKGMRAIPLPRGLRKSVQ